MTERKSWVDICKGFAIVLVVIGHIGDAYEGELKCIHTFIYLFHMPLFVFIGGYLASFSKEKGIKSICIKKVLAYGIPYIVFSVLYWLFKMLGGQIVDNPVGIKDLLLIFIYPLSFMWYIYALLIISLLVEIIKKFFNNYKSIILMTSIFCYLMSIVLQYFPSIRESGYMDLIFVDVMKNFIWYALGYTVGDRIIEIASQMLSRKLISVLATTMLFGVLVVAVAMQLTKVIFFDVMWAMVGIMGLIFLSMLISKNKMLEFLGRNTLSIYVLHGIITSAIQILFAKIGIRNDLLLIVLCTICGVVVPLFIYNVCARIWWLDICFYPNRYIRMVK